MHADSQYCQHALIPDASTVVSAPVNSEGGAESGRYGRRGLLMAELIRLLEGAWSISTWLNKEPRSSDEFV